MKRLDTHQHLAFKDRFTYSWMDELPPLDEDRYYPENYWADADGCGVAGTIFMENAAAEGQGGDEARFLCRLVRDPATRIRGVIASGRPESSGFPKYLDTINDEKLSGIRRILHTQPDELSRSDRFRENLRLLGKRGLPFDLCFLQRQLPIAAELVRACPNTTFVLDHCGIPDIATNEAPHGDGWLFWKKQIAELAAFPNVNCKVSGIILYASKPQRSADGLRPYVETVIETFGWERVVWGGDWPVCTLGGGLEMWCRIIDEILAEETVGRRELLFFRNAERIYNLREA